MSNELTDAQVQENLDLIKEAKTLEDLKAFDAVKKHEKIKPVLTAKVAEIKAADKKAADDKKAEEKAAKEAGNAKGGEYVLLCAIGGVGSRGEVVKISADDAKRFGSKMIRKATAEDKKKASGAQIDGEE